MKMLESFDNLNRLYKKGRSTLYRSIIIFLIIIVLSIVLVATNPDEGLFGIAMFLMMISFVALLVLGICALAFKLISNKAFRKFTDEELSRINEDIPNVPEFKGFYVTRDALIYVRANFSIIPLRDIIWVYKQITTNRVNGISTGKSYTAIIALKNKKSSTFPTNKKDDLMNFLHQELTKYRKGIFFGYSDQYHALYNMYIDRMIQMSEEAERQ